MNSTSNPAPDPEIPPVGALAPDSPLPGPLDPPPLVSPLAPPLPVVPAPVPPARVSATPVFDPHYPMSTGAPILLERLQAIRAAQKAAQKAGTRPKLHPVARFLNNLWIWLILADLILVFCGFAAHLPGNFIREFFAASLVPRLALNTAQMLHLVRRDFFGAPLTVRAYFFGLAIFVVFVAGIAEPALYFLLPLLTIVFYGRLLLWAYRGLRTSRAAVRSSRP